MDFYAIFLNPERMERRLEALAETIRDVVVEGQNPPYRQSVRYGVVDEKAEVRLGMPGLSQEWDRKGYDVKARLLASSKAKIAKDGSRYMHVPMKDGIVTASSKGKPWMTKSKQGLHRMRKAVEMMPELVAASRRRMQPVLGVV